MESTRADEIKVEVEVVESTVEIKAAYPAFAIIEAGFDEPFRKQLLEQYESKVKGNYVKDCILSITADVAGSQVVKGIFELYKSVKARSGTLICANYPADYVRALTDLGLPSLLGSRLFE